MKRILAVSTLILLLFVSGCNKDETVTSESLATYPIAGLFSLTGSWSSLGITSQEALNLAIADVNTYLEERQSNIRFSSEVYDTKLDAELAKTYFNTAVTSLESKFIIGPQSSAEVAALIDLANDAETLLISQGSTATSLALPNDAVFRLCPGDGPEGAAISRYAFQSGKQILITLARDDAGNLGLQTSVTNSFAALGGQTDAIPSYSTEQSDFTDIINQLRTKIQQHVDTFGAAAVGVYLASFDECTQLFHQANNDPILSSVNWYGGDGAVLSPTLLADTEAANFAATVSYFAPNFGLPTQEDPKRDAIVAGIRAQTGIDPDAYTLAVYDAVWVLAITLADFPEASKDFNILKTRFSEQANRFNGLTGPVQLNKDGDRASGAFDFWGIVAEGENYSWQVVGNSN